MLLIRETGYTMEKIDKLQFSIDCSRIKKIVLIALLIVVQYYLFMSFSLDFCIKKQKVPQHQVKINMVFRV